MERNDFPSESSKSLTNPGLTQLDDYGPRHRTFDPSLNGSVPAVIPVRRLGSCGEPNGLQAVRLVSVSTPQPCRNQTIKQAVKRFIRFFAPYNILLPLDCRRLAVRRAEVPYRARRLCHLILLTRFRKLNLLTTMPINKGSSDNRGDVLLEYGTRIQHLRGKRITHVIKTLQP